MFGLKKPTSHFTRQKINILKVKFKISVLSVVKSSFFSKLN